MTTHVEAHGKKLRLAAVVVPNSRRRPHVVSRELQEQQGRKAKFLLREGEVWVRNAGGRTRATAEDMDAMYEARLLSATRDATEPLARRIGDLEGELGRLRQAAPEPCFGVALPVGRQPGQEAEVRPATEILFTPAGLRSIAADISWARKRAEKERAQQTARGFSAGVRLGPGPDEFEGYARGLEDWLDGLRRFVMVQLALSNTGEVPAEDLSVEIEIPPEISCRAELPVEKPERPRDFRIVSLGTPSTGPMIAARRPDDLIGPDLDHDSRLAVWEVERLYHGRPVRTDSDPDYVNGLLLDREPFERAAGEGGSVYLRYTIRAANLRRPVEGTLRLLPASPSG